jgi:hypothetical protein
MKPHISIWVVKLQCSECTDPILRCFINPEGLSYRDFLVGMVIVLVSWLMI